MKDCVPRLSTVAALGHTEHPMTRLYVKGMEAATRTLGLKLQVLEVPDADALLGRRPAGDRGCALTDAPPRAVVRPARVGIDARAEDIVTELEVDPSVQGVASAARACVQHSAKRPRPGHSPGGAGRGGLGGRALGVARAAGRRGRWPLQGRPPLRSTPSCRFTWSRSAGTRPRPRWACSSRSPPWCRCSCGPWSGDRV